MTVLSWFQKSSLGSRTTTDFYHSPTLYVDESEEDKIERGDQPKRYPNRLRWRWPGRLKESLVTAARRERAVHAELGNGRTIGDERAARWSRRAVTAPQATAAIGVAPTLRCDVGLVTHASANDDLRQQGRNRVRV